MGFGDWMIKKTAKSTANSLSKYVNSGQYGDEISSLKAWVLTRRNSSRSLSLIDMLNEQGYPPYIIGHSIFNSEMGITESSLDDSVSLEIRKIFQSVFV